MLESDDYVSEYKTFGTPCIKTKKQIMDELSEPCSRFAFDVRKIKSDFNVMKKASRIDPLSEQGLTLATDVPANWQAFARYLYEAEITLSKDILSPMARHDIPKLYAAGFHAGKVKKGDGREADRSGYGVSLNDPLEAISKAAGELLERHFSSMYRSKDLLFASYEDLKRRRFGPKPLDIFSLNGFLPWQEARWWKFKKNASTPIGWVRGENLTRNMPVYIPAQLVYWNYSVEDEMMMLAEGNTNGAAGHFTRDEAILSALLELIQRDGFTIHWLRNAHPHLIDERTIEDVPTKDILTRFKESGVEAYLLDTTTDIGVPTCVCVCIDARGEHPHLYLAASAGFTVQSTIFSAILECIAVFNSLNFEKEPFILENDYKPFTRLITRMERLRLWKGKEMIDRFRPFLKGPLVSEFEFMRGVQQYETVRDQLGYIQNSLHALGDRYDIYIHEFKDPILDLLGYHVVRVVVPAAMNLYLNENLAQLNTERLSSVPAKLGFKARQELNPWPHPFP